MRLRAAAQQVQLSFRSATARTNTSEQQQQQQRAVYFLSAGYMPKRLGRLTEREAVLLSSKAAAWCAETSVCVAEAAAA